MCTGDRLRLLGLSAAELGVEFRIVLARQDLPRRRVLALAHGQLNDSPGLFTAMSMRANSIRPLKSVRAAG
jgi:hypothetical protein